MKTLSTMARRVPEAQSFSALVGAKLTSFCEREAVLEVPTRLRSYADHSCTRRH